MMDTAPPSPYRLLACDLDGTLIGDDLTVSPRVCQALAAVQARGVHVTLATGRGFPETLSFAKLLKIQVPLICYQGGLIRHPATKELLYRATMDRGLVLQVIELARAENWHLVVYIDDAMYIQEYQHDPQFYLDMLGRDIRCVDDVASVVSQNRSDPAKFLVVTEASLSERVRSVLNGRFGDRMHIVRSHLRFVEGNPLGVNKGDGLRRLADHLGVPQRQVMAIGDQGNDVPMLGWAGLGVAMASGSQDARAVSDWVAPPLLEDGAAVAVERFLLTAQRFPNDEN